MKLLLVDDSVSIRSIIRQMLMSWDDCSFDIVEAEDGQEALSLIEKSPFDMVMTDWNMPRLSGLELVQEVRARGIATPILILSSNYDRVTITKATAAGASEYLIKPVTRAVLRRKLDKYLTVETR